MKLEPTRELDAEIAVKVFGYTREEKVCGKNDVFVEGTKVIYWMNQNGRHVATKINNKPIKDLSIVFPIPYFSTRIEDAWKLVEWLINEKGFAFHLKYNRDNEDWGKWSTGGGWLGMGKTFPLAVCDITLQIIKSQGNKLQ